MAETTTERKLVDLDLLRYFKTKEDAFVKAEDEKVLSSAKEYTDTEAGKVNSAIEEIDTRLTSAEDTLDVLVGEDTGKSARAIAIEALAEALIPENANEARDTLEEIAAWIQQHPEDAAALNQAITALEALVGKLPEDATASTVVGYIDEINTAIDVRLDVIEESMGETGSVAEAIEAAKTEAVNTAKTYSDGLNTAMDSRVTAVESGVSDNADAIAAINDETTGAIATSEKYTDAAVETLEAKINEVKTATSTFATNEEIDKLFENDDDSSTNLED